MPQILIKQKNKRAELVHKNQYLFTLKSPTGLDWMYGTNHPDWIHLELDGTYRELPEDVTPKGDVIVVIRSKQRFYKCNVISHDYGVARIEGCEDFSAFLWPSADHIIQTFDRVSSGICSSCKGKGKLILFTSVEICDACQGSGSC